MKFYFNNAGIMDGVKKAGTVLLWIAVSGALSALIEFISKLPIDSSDYLMIAFVGLINAALAGALKWAQTKK